VTLAEATDEPRHDLVRECPPDDPPPLPFTYSLLEGRPDGAPLDGRCVVSAWPELREARTIRAGQAAGMVVKCGLMDTMLADIPVSVVFVYATAPDENRMADGLSRALAQLPVFAGRLRETPDSLEIVCDDSGVPMMSYDLDGTVADAIGRLALPGSDYVDHIPAPATRAGELPLLTVRITRLSDGGMLMGCSWHHAVGDMQTFMLLMRTWSAFVEGTPLPDTYVVQDMDAFLEDRLPAEDSGRPGFRLPSPEDAVEVNRELENAVRANRIVQAYFSDDEVSRIRAEVTAAAGQRLSTNDVLCGHLVSTIRRLDDDPEGRWLAIPINIRRYLGVEPGTLGNLVNEVFLSCAPKSTADRLAVDIRAAVNAYGPTSLNIRTNRAFLESVGRSRLRECIPVGFDPAQRTFTTTNWTRFGVYDVVFSGEAPTLFSPATNLALPWVSWLTEGFYNSGYLFMVALPAKLANRVRSAEGRAALHAYRDPDEELPSLVRSIKKMV
jgi:hypothetical protein